MTMNPANNNPKVATLCGFGSSDLNVGAYGSQTLKALGDKFTLIKTKYTPQISKSFKAMSEKSSETIGNPKKINGINRGKVKIGNQASNYAIGVSATRNAFMVRGDLHLSTKNKKLTEKILNLFRQITHQSKSVQEHALSASDNHESVHSHSTSCCPNEHTPQDKLPEKADRTPNRALNAIEKKAFEQKVKSNRRYLFSLNTPGHKEILQDVKHIEIFRQCEEYASFIAQDIGKKISPFINPLQNSTSHEDALGQIAEDISRSYSVNLNKDALIAHFRSENTPPNNPLDCFQKVLKTDLKDAFKNRLYGEQIIDVAFAYAEAKNIQPKTNEIYIFKKIDETDGSRTLEKITNVEIENLKSFTNCDPKLQDKWSKYKESRANQVLKYRVTDILLKDVLDNMSEEKQADILRANGYFYNAADDIGGVYGAATYSPFRKFAQFLQMSLALSDDPEKDKPYALLTGSCGSQQTDAFILGAPLFGIEQSSARMAQLNSHSNDHLEATMDNFSKINGNTLDSVILQSSVAQMNEEELELNRDNKYLPTLTSKSNTAPSDSKVEFDMIRRNDCVHTMAVLNVTNLEDYLTHNLHLKSKNSDLRVTISSYATLPQGDDRPFEQGNKTSIGAFADDGEGVIPYKMDERFGREYQIIESIDTVENRPGFHGEIARSHKHQFHDDAGLGSKSVLPSETAAHDQTYLDTKEGSRVTRDSIARHCNAAVAFSNAYKRHAHPSEIKPLSSSPDLLLVRKEKTTTPFTHAFLTKYFGIEGSFKNEVKSVSFDENTIDACVEKLNDRLTNLNSDDQENLKGIFNSDIKTIEFLVRAGFDPYYHENLINAFKKCVVEENISTHLQSRIDEINNSNDPTPLKNAYLKNVELQQNHEATKNNLKVLKEAALQDLEQTTHNLQVTTWTTDKNNHSLPVCGSNPASNSADFKLDLSLKKTIDNADALRDKQDEKLGQWQDIHANTFVDLIKAFSGITDTEISKNDFLNALKELNGELKKRHHGLKIDDTKDQVLSCFLKFTDKDSWEPLLRETTDENISFGALGTNIEERIANSVDTESHLYDQMKTLDHLCSYKPYNLEVANRKPESDENFNIVKLEHFKNEINSFSNEIKILSNARTLAYGTKNNTEIAETQNSDLNKIDGVQARSAPKIKNRWYSKNENNSISMPRWLPGIAAGAYVATKVATTVATPLSQAATTVLSKISPVASGLFGATLLFSGVESMRKARVSNRRLDEQFKIKSVNLTDQEKIQDHLLKVQHNIKKAINDTQSTTRQQKQQLEIISKQLIHIRANIVQIESEIKNIYRERNDNRFYGYGMGGLFALTGVTLMTATALTYTSAATAGRALVLTANLLVLTTATVFMLRHFREMTYKDETHITLEQEGFNNEGDEVLNAVETKDQTKPEKLINRTETLSIERGKYYLTDKNDTKTEASYDAIKNQAFFIEGRGTFKIVRDDNVIEVDFKGYEVEEQKIKKDGEVSHTILIQKSSKRPAELVELRRSFKQTLRGRDQQMMIRVTNQRQAHKEAYQSWRRLAVYTTGLIALSAADVASAGATALPGTVIGTALTIASMHEVKNLFAYIYPRIAETGGRHNLDGLHLHANRLLANPNLPSSNEASKLHAGLAGSVREKTIETFKAMNEQIHKALSKEKDYQENMRHGHLPGQVVGPDQAVNPNRLKNIAIESLLNANYSDQKAVQFLKDHFNAKITANKPNPRDHRVTSALIQMMDRATQVSLSSNQVEQNHLMEEIKSIQTTLQSFPESTQVVSGTTGLRESLQNELAKKLALYDRTVQRADAANQALQAVRTFKNTTEVARHKIDKLILQGNLSGPEGAQQAEEDYKKEFDDLILQFMVQTRWITQVMSRSEIHDMRVGNSPFKVEIYNDKGLLKTSSIKNVDVKDIDKNWSDWKGNYSTWTPNQNQSREWFFNLIIQTLPQHADYEANKIFEQELQLRRATPERQKELANKRYLMNNPKDVPVSTKKAAERRIENFSNATVSSALDAWHSVTSSAGKNYRPKNHDPIRSTAS